METDGKVRQQLAREITVMLTYALEEGLELDPNVAALLGGDPPASTHASFASQPASSLTALHSALVKVVAPATPGSLEATAPAPGPIGFLLNPPLIGLMVLAAVVCAAGFVKTLHPMQVAATSKWNLLFGAGLGSAFYGLFTAHDYVKNRTFDPRYNSVYLIRFVLGIIAGLILASLGVAEQSDVLKKLGVGVIALLGGYSAEAVNQILQRLVDILLAAVKGGGGDVAKAKEEQVKAKASAQVTSVKQSMSQELTTLLGDTELTDPVRQKLKEIQDKLK